MTPDEIFDAMVGLGAIGVAVGAVFAVAIYVWMSLAFAAIFRKAGEAAWKGWVPVVNMWTLMRIGGRPGWWALLQYGVMLVAVAIGTVIVVLTTLNGGGFGADSVALLLVVAGIYLVASVIVLILHIAMLIGVNRAFGLGGGYTVLGLFFFVIWASVVGWGSATLRGSRAAPQVYENAAAHAFGAPGAYGAPANVPAGLPPMPPASAAPTTRMPVPPPPAMPVPPVSAPAPPVVPAPAMPTMPAVPPSVPAAPSVPPAPAAPAAPPAPVSAPLPAPVASVPASPVPASPVAAETIVAAPVPAPAPVAEPQVAARDPWAPPAPPVIEQAPAPTPVAASPTPVAASDDDIDERTILASRRTPSAPTWSLVLPDGVAVSLTTDAVVLGRNPVAPDEAPDAEELAVPDTTRTVSKTHALLRREAEGWTLTDLGSTNGVFLFDADGNEVEVEGSAPVHGAFLLGDATLHLTEG